MSKSALHHKTANTSAGRSFVPRFAVALILALAAAAIGFFHHPGEAAPHPSSDAPRLALEAEGETAAYWLDGTVNLLLTAHLRNEGETAFTGARRVDVSCEKDGAAVSGCSRTMLIRLPDGFGPASQTLSVRAPTGELDVSMDYGADEPLEMKVVVPERALGVDEDVFACFTDLTNVGTLWQAERGVGCGGWASEKISKWDQTNPVKVWVTGLPTWTREFREALTEVAGLARLEIEWAARPDDAEITAYVGASRTSFSDLCSQADGEIGCSSVTVNENGEITDAGILIQSGSTSFSGLSEFSRRRALSAMYRETIRAVSLMRHRAEPGSVMEANHAGAVELSPMDEALLRLHGSPAIKPGTALDDVLDLVVFKSDLLDSRTRDVLPDPALDKWKLARGAHRAMVDGERARFRMRAESAQCDTEFEEAAYDAGNIDAALGRFGWVKLTYGRSKNPPADFTIETAPGRVEYWHRSTGRWWTGTEDEYRENTEGWRRDLADPYRLLTTALIHADWSESGGMTDLDDGGKRIDFDINLRTAAPGENMARLEGSLTINPDTFALTAFEAAWTLENQPCDFYRVIATEGETGGGAFEIPTVVRQTSEALDVCVADLGAIDGALDQTFSWFRHCAPNPTEGGSADDFQRVFDFSIGDWLILRTEAEVKSGAATRLRLARSEGDGVWRDAASGEGAGLVSAWAQRLLPPGDYRIILTTGAHHAPESFDLIISSSEAGPPPYEFRSAIPGGEHTCGLLDNAAVVCWGRNEAGQTSTPLGYRFSSVAVGDKHTCALRRDGVPVCWGSDEDGQSSPPRFRRFTALAAGPDFTCGLSGSGTAVCWGAFAESGGSTLYGQRLESLSAGERHVCGVTRGGVSCWGADDQGQATPPDNLGRTRAVASGDAHACALGVRGGVRCWGADDHGQASPPTGTFSAITAGGNLSCAIRREDGSATCWGELAAWSEASIPSGEPFTRIYTSSEHSCMIRADDGLPTCWGRDEYGQASPPSDWPLTPINAVPTPRPTRGTGL